MAKDTTKADTGISQPEGAPVVSPTSEPVTDSHFATEEKSTEKQAANIRFVGGKSVNGREMLPTMAINAGSMPEIKIELSEEQQRAGFYHPKARFIVEFYPGYKLILPKKG